MKQNFYKHIAQAGFTHDMSLDDMDGMPCAPPPLTIYSLASHRPTYRSNFPLYNPEILKLMIGWEKKYQILLLKILL